MLRCRLSGHRSVLVQPVCQWGRRLQHPTRSMSGVGGQQVGWVPVSAHVNITQARSGVLFLRLKEHSHFASVSSIKQMDPRTRTRVAATLWPNWEWVMGKDPPTPKHPLCFLVNHQWTKNTAAHQSWYLWTRYSIWVHVKLGSETHFCLFLTLTLLCAHMNPVVMLPTCFAPLVKSSKRQFTFFCCISVGSVMLCYLHSPFPICGHLSNNTVVLDGNSCFSHAANLSWCGYKYLVDCLSKRGIPVCSRLLIDSLTWRINSTECVKGTSTLHNAHLLKYNSKTVILRCKWGRKSLFMSQAKFILFWNVSLNLFFFYNKSVLYISQGPFNACV